MPEYAKKWLSAEDQFKKLDPSGVAISSQDAGIQLLRTVEYYRLTGYPYPFRESVT